MDNRYRDKINAFGEIHETFIFGLAQSQNIPILKVIRDIHDEIVRNEEKLTAILNGNEFKTHTPSIPVTFSYTPVPGNDSTLTPYPTPTPTPAIYAGTPTPAFPLVYLSINPDEEHVTETSEEQDTITDTRVLAPVDGKNSGLPETPRINLAAKTIRPPDMNKYKDLICRTEPFRIDLSPTPTTPVPIKVDFTPTPNPDATEAEIDFAMLNLINAGER